jgi:hypothetical protein
MLMHHRKSWAGQFLATLRRIPLLAAPGIVLGSPRVWVHTEGKSAGASSRITEWEERILSHVPKGVKFVARALTDLDGTLDTRWGSRDLLLLVAVASNLMLTPGAANSTSVPPGLTRLQETSPENVHELLRFAVAADAAYRPTRKSVAQQLAAVSPSAEVGTLSLFPSPPLPLPPLRSLPHLHFHLHLHLHPLHTPLHADPSRASPCGSPTPHSSMVPGG